MPALLTLVAGSRLGPYEIVSSLGSGGMGDVYRAHDPRMGRDVAVKISSEVFSDRFEREVRAVAALNHRNICQVYDVGPNYLVMELIEGPTLADRIGEGAIPLDEALAIARQIADALDAAHQKGIIHRDLKPANIKLTSDGAVKVLDFGLAKMAEPALAGAPDESPTMALSPTIAGEIMGTAAYMSPEQARGKAVDKRADIWAFGVVLYEMLTGRRLFDGETVSDTIAGVLTKEPDWHRVPPKAAPLLKNCLEKDCRRRLRDIGDAWRLINDAPERTDRTPLLPWAIAGLLFVGLSVAVALWAPWRAATGSSDRSSQPLDYDLGPDAFLATTIGPAVVISPDGTRLVFVSQREDGPPQLFTRRLDEPKSVLMPGTDGAFAPFFSPDGQWVGFFSGGKLKKARVDGSQVVTLCDAPAGRGGSWSEDGTMIVAALDALGNLSQVEASEGGKVTQFTRLGAGENSHRWPDVLPGGHGVLFNASIAYGNFDEAAIAVASLTDHRTKILLDHAGMSPRYLPSGHLVYAAKGSLFAVRFDLERLEIKGTPISLDSLMSNPNLGSAEMDFSRTGTFVYRTGSTEGLRTLQWVYSDGKTEPLGLEPAGYLCPRLSPDNSHLAYMVNQGPNTDLWTYDLQRGNRTHLTVRENAYNPLWSPDSQLVVFQTPGGMFWKRADGSGDEHPLIQGRLVSPSSFSPDGTQLLFFEQTGGNKMWSLPVDLTGGQLRARGESRLLMKAAASVNFPVLSPDGHWLAYADADGGTYQVYVLAITDKGSAPVEDKGRVQISTSSGWLPMWSGSGHELFYRTEADQKIMVATYSVKGGKFVADKPHVWFAKRLSNVGLSRNLDIDDEGKRCIVAMPAESSESKESRSHTMLRLNFFDELWRKVTTSK